MTNPCNQLSLNEAALMSILRDEAQNALELEGQKLLIHMRQEVHRTVGGGGPGKPRGATSLPPGWTSSRYLFPTARSPWTSAIPPPAKPTWYAP